MIELIATLCAILYGARRYRSRANVNNDLEVRIRAARTYGTILRTARKRETEFLIRVVKIYVRISC